ncbi:hypothetical protein J6590_097255, partial [Homalodisca vitripennis]
PSRPLRDARGQEIPRQSHYHGPRASEGRDLPETVRILRLRGARNRGVPEAGSCYRQVQT